MTSTQTAVQDAIAHVQAATPATGKSLEQELAETKAALAKALAPKQAATITVAKTVDFSAIPIKAAAAPKPKPEVLLNQRHAFNDNLGRPIIVGVSADLKDDKGKTYNMGVGIRLTHPVTGKVITKYHKAATWATMRKDVEFELILSDLVNEAIALGYVPDAK